MKNIVWQIEYIKPPSVIKYCKKCGEKTEYTSSEQFRINAQRKYLDIWLIYKCGNCNNTWNETIHSRINPKNLDGELLECFHKNDKELSKDYAMDIELLCHNGVEVKLPEFVVKGERFDVTESVDLVIKSEYYLPVKVSAVLRKKLNLSQRELIELIDEEKIEMTSKEKLKKIKLNKETRVIFNKPSACNNDKLLLQSG